MGARLVSGNDNTIDWQFMDSEIVNEFEDFLVISDPKIGSDFVFFNISSINAYDDLNTIFELMEDFDFCVGVEAR